MLTNSGNISVHRGSLRLGILATALLWMGTSCTEIAPPDFFLGAQPAPGGGVQILFLYSCSGRQPDRVQVTFSVKGDKPTPLWRIVVNKPTTLPSPAVQTVTVGNPPPGYSEVLPLSGGLPQRGRFDVSLGPADQEDADVGFSFVREDLRKGKVWTDDGKLLTHVQFREHSATVCEPNAD